MMGWRVHGSSAAPAIGFCRAMDRPPFLFTAATKLLIVMAGPQTIRGISDPTSRTKVAGAFRGLLRCHKRHACHCA
jgi:hypothetical protein